MRHEPHVVCGPILKGVAMATATKSANIRAELKDLQERLADRQQDLREVEATEAIDKDGKLNALSRELADTKNDLHQIRLVIPRKKVSIRNLKRKLEKQTAALTKMENDLPVKEKHEAELTRQIAARRQEIIDKVKI